MTPSQEAFCRAVVAGHQLSDAYQMAFPHASRRKAQRRSGPLSRLPLIKARIDAMRAKAEELAILKAADIIEETRRLALSSIKGLISAEGRVLLPHELDARTAASVKSFKVDELGRVEYQLWDKNAALERAVKMLGLYEADNSQQRAEPPSVIELVALTAVEIQADDDDDGLGDDEGDDGA
jgi:hypothetical protein